MIDIKDLKTRIDNGEVIELHSDRDVAYLYTGNWKSHKDYVFMLNATVILSLRLFEPFRKAVNEKIKEYSLLERIDENGE